MRNLSLSSTSEAILGDSRASATAIDLDEDAVYIASISSEDDTLIEIRKLDASNGQNQVCSVLYIKCSFNSAPLQAHASLLNAIIAEANSFTKIMSFRFLPDSRKLILILRGGDMHSYCLETKEVNSPLPRVSIVMIRARAG